MAFNKFSTILQLEIMTAKENDQCRSIKQFRLKTVLEDANVTINISHTISTKCTWPDQLIRLHYFNTAAQRFSRIHNLTWSQMKVRSIDNTNIPRQMPNW